MTVIRSQPHAAATMVVLLNYRTPAATVTAVRSLISPTIDASAIIVVDNGSADGSADLIARELPGTHLIVAAANGGFSAGCNLGISQALKLGAARVLLLNSDAIASPCAVGALERGLDADPYVGIVGPVIVSQPHPEQIESQGIRYSRTTGRMRHHSHGTRLDANPAFERREVDAVSGCAMMIKRQVFERIGPLAEEYFFGFEDLDFCLRARAAGFRSACIGAAVISHEGSLSIGRTSGRRIYFATRNHLLLARRSASSHSRPGRWLQTTAILGFNLAYVLLRADVPRRDGLHAFINGARDHFRGRYGAGPLPQ